MKNCNVKINDNKTSKAIYFLKLRYRMVVIRRPSGNMTVLVSKVLPPPPPNLKSSYAYGWSTPETVAVSQNLHIYIKKGYTISSGKSFHYQ